MKHVVSIPKPTISQVDLVFSYRNFAKKMIRACGQTMYRHKMKSLIVILGLYGAHKTFGFYKSVKSALNPFADIQQQMTDHAAVDNDNAQNSTNKMKNNDPNEKGLQLLKTYIRSDPMHLLQVKILQSSLRNVLENLPQQVNFISKQVEQFYKLSDASARAKQTAETLTMV